MSIFNYERNIEDDLVAFFALNDVTATTSRSLTELNASNIQVSSEYGGALDDTRQLINGVHEYDNHEANIAIFINTFRDDKVKHFERVAKVRSLMLINLKGIKSYYVYDIVPLASTNVELADNNTDQTQLNYNIKFKVDLSQL